MTNTKMIVNKETWNKLAGEERDWILYNSLQDLDERLRHLENKSFFNKSLAFLGGIFGGMVSFFGSKAIH